MFWRSHIRSKAVVAASLADICLSVTLALGRAAGDKLLLKQVLCSSTNLEMSDGGKRRGNPLYSFPPEDLPSPGRSLSPFLAHCDKPPRSPHKLETWQNSHLSHVTIVTSPSAHLHQHTAAWTLFLLVQSDLSQNSIFSSSLNQRKPFVGAAQ